MAYLEKSVEQYLRKKVVEHGGMCIKLTGEAGLPDRLVLIHKCRHAFVELKRPEGRLSLIQQEYHRRLKALGQPVWVLWNFDDVDKFIEHYFGK